MTKLNTMNIISLADSLLETMNRLDIKERCSLSFSVSKGDFEKIDEDLYYRLNETATEDGYVPSDGRTVITYGGVDITITGDADTEG